MQHLQKSGGGGGRSQSLSTFAYPLRSIFRTLFEVPYAATPLFATLTKTPGVWGYSSHFGTRPFHVFALLHYLATSLLLLLSTVSSCCVVDRRANAGHNFRSPASAGGARISEQGALAFLQTY